jgi:hypothetical protein
MQYVWHTQQRVDICEPHSGVAPLLWLTVIVTVLAVSHPRQISLVFSVTADKWMVCFPPPCSTWSFNLASWHSVQPGAGAS